MNITIFTIFSLAILLLVLLFLFRKKSLQKKNETFILVHEIEPYIEHLIQGRYKDNFFGITSNGADCIYVVLKRKHLHIEYEILDEDQLNYIPALHDFAESKSLELIKTSFQNTLENSNIKNAPVYVLRLEIIPTLTAKIIGEMMAVVFRNKPNLKYQIVP